MTTPTAIDATTRPHSEAKRAPRAHLHEIDLTRAVTALSVIGVHVAAYTLVLAMTPLASQLQNAAIDALHFTREIFLAITAFVLTYSYANKPFSAKAFWRKRGLGVLLPYVVWSLFYEIFVRQPLPPSSWASPQVEWVGRFQRSAHGPRLVAALLHPADHRVLHHPAVVPALHQLGGQAPVAAARRRPRGAGGAARAGLRHPAIDGGARHRHRPLHRHPPGSLPADLRALHRRRRAGGALFAPGARVGAAARRADHRRIVLSLALLWGNLLLPTRCGAQRGDLRHLGLSAGDGVLRPGDLGLHLLDRAALGHQARADFRRAGRASGC